jgi:predicted GIY-YIG superfamily endonuclease
LKEREFRTIKMNKSKTDFVKEEIKIKCFSRRNKIKLLNEDVSSSFNYE